MLQMTYFKQMIHVFSAEFIIKKIIYNITYLLVRLHVFMGNSERNNKKCGKTKRQDFYHLYKKILFKINNN